MDSNLLVKIIAIVFAAGNAWCIFCVSRSLSEKNVQSKKFYKSVALAVVSTTLLLCGVFAVFGSHFYLASGFVAGAYFFLIVDSAPFFKQHPILLSLTSCSTTLMLAVMLLFAPLNGARDLMQSEVDSNRKLHEGFILQNKLFETLAESQKLFADDLEKVISIQLRMSAGSDKDNEAKSILTNIAHRIELEKQLLDAVLTNQPATK